MHLWSLTGCLGEHLDILSVYFEINLSLLLDANLLVCIRVVVWGFITLRIPYHIKKTTLLHPNVFCPGRAGNLWEQIFKKYEKSVKKYKFR